MIIESISVSRYGVYAECPQHYKYKYHLRIPSPEESPVYFDYGKAIHKIIETFTLARGQGDIGTITKEVLGGKIELEPGKKCPKFPPDYMQKLPEHLRAFMRISEKIGTDGLVEWPFKYDLDPPNGKVYNGFIDRIIVKNGEYLLLDWKTTKKGPWRKNKKNITTDLQLQAYCRIVQKEWDVPADKIRAALYFLDGGELVGATFSQSTLESVEKRLLAAYDEIKAQDPNEVQGNVGNHCKRCEYRKLCPFYKLTE